MVVLALILMLTLVVRRSAGVAGILALLILVGPVGSAYAIPTQNFTPAVGSFDYVVTQDGRITLPSAKFLWQYERNPFVVNFKPSNDRALEIIEARHTLHLQAAAAIGRFQFGLDVPIIFSQSQHTYGFVNNGNAFKNGLGDIRLNAKLRLFTYRSLNIAAAVDFALPTSVAGFTGEANGSATPKLIVSGSLGPVDLAANAGFRIRGDETFNTTGFQRMGVGQLFTASVAGRWHVFSRGQYGLSIVSDLYTQTTLNSVTQEEVPLEWLNGASVRLPRGFDLFAGVGVGLTRGVGSPEPRVFAGLGWTWDACKKCNETRTIVRREEVIVYKEKKILVPVMVERLITIPPIYFDTDKSTLRVESKRTLKDVVALLKRYPQVNRLRIEGYCDHRASKNYNIALSKRRTKAAVDFLKSLGVSVRLEPRSHGKDYQVDKTKTEEGMQLNRRVEFFVTSIR
jgi:outer membrane protein OmpA-like peptidoglycan-associated protein